MTRRRRYMNFAALGRTPTRCGVEKSRRHDAAGARHIACSRNRRRRFDAVATLCYRVRSAGDYVTGSHFISRRHFDTPRSISVSVPFVAMRISFGRARRRISRRVRSIHCRAGVQFTSHAVAIAARHGISPATAAHRGHNISGAMKPAIAGDIFFTECRDNFGRNGETSIAGMSAVIMATISVK